MEKQPLIPKKHIAVLFGVLALFGLYLAKGYSYLLFHSLAELFSIIVACCIFMVAWNTKQFVKNSYFLFIGIAYLFVGGIDLVHTLSYKGMGVFQGYDTNLATQLWIVGRYIESLSLFIAPFFLYRKLKANLTFSVYTVVISVLLGSIFYWNIFPDCFIEGVGLTPFKKINEYIISLILLASIALLLRKRQSFDTGVLKLIIASIILTVMSELSFTFYIHAYGFSSMIGHFFKIISFYLIYKALIETTLLKPYDLMFRELNQSEAALKMSQERLEQRVEERTLELVMANEQLGREIEGHKLAEKEKEMIQAQLLQAQKMESIGRLTGGIAHDFNNLLTIIRGHADLAMMKANEAHPLYRHLKQIYSATGRAANLTHQLLLFSRNKPTELTYLNINKKIEELLKMLSHLIGEDIAIQIDLEPDLRTIRADAGNIEQVIMNLTVNAKDAMPKGGKLVFKTENVTLDKGDCKDIFELEPGEFVCLSIEDTGTGMDKETLQHIFEPFFSTKEAGKGTGLGLSVVYGIIKRHGGCINVYSKPGLGSKFKIYLPVVSAKPEPEDEFKTISLQKLQGNGERILLVEDEEELRKLTTSMLGENGYVVFEAANVEEAIDIFEREKRRFHLVFSDITLPDKTGLQLIDQLLSRKPDLRVLLNSGYLDEKLQWTLIQERGFRLLQKPYALADLLQAIRDVIVRENGLSH